MIKQWLVLDDKMTHQTITIDLPESVYQQFRQASETVHRPMDEIVAEAVVAATPATAVTQTMRSALAQLAYLNDAALWQAARSTMTVEQRERLATLRYEQQRIGLTTSEQAEEESLQKLYRETILVRAQAASLLKQRGYDISDVSQFTPLE